MSRPRIAVLCSAHGLGHLTRQLAIGERLAARGASLCYFTAAPDAVVHETLPEAEVRRRAVDVGIVQHDSVRQDLAATRRLLDERLSEAAVDRLALELGDFDLAIVDIAPNALEAARRADLPAIAIGSFTWSWIYRHYPELEDQAARLDAWQAPHPAIEILPGPGLSGFAEIARHGLVGRAAARRDLGVPGRVVLVSFGGFGLAEVDRLLPRIAGVTWLLAPPMLPLKRPDCRFLTGLPYPALVASCDAVLTKPGYSILVEAALCGAPLAWVSRRHFPEVPWLEAAMRARGDVPVGAVEPGDEPMASPARVAEALEALWSRPRPQPVPGDGAEAVAAEVWSRLVG